jgi:uncharacterized protein DUF1553
MQGTPPSHPELLDYLATQFMRQGWSLKKLHRLIVSSATYRQSSTYRPDLKDADPNNRLLARQNRLRLDAEAVRDAALSASGMLDRSLGGPTTHPPQPDGVYAFTQNKKSWPTSQGPERYRRAMYTTFIRSAPYPLFTTFDAPSFATACTRRPRSNTPLQALTLANDEAFVEFAQGMAARLEKEQSEMEAAEPMESSDRSKIARAFLLCLAREPSALEIEAVLAYLNKQRSAFGDSAAAWTAVARSLLNTDEFITRE